MLIVLSGRSGTGKTTIARELARQLGAVYLRIDSIEQPIRGAYGVVDETGYRIAYAIAEDNLRLGRTVVADSVNPLPMTREAWRAVGERAKTKIVDVEVVCADSAEHKRRVETREADIPGLRLPSWQEVVDRDYRAWDRERLVIDTARLNVEQSVAMIRAAL
jgi:predicted kinase